MNTLQKITDIEAQIENLNAKLKTFEILVTHVPNLSQDIGYVKQDIQQLSDAIKNVVNTVTKRTKDLGDMDNMIITRMMGLEQSYSSIAKTLTAVVSELSDSKVLDQSAVMTRIRKGEENLDKQRIANMLQMKIIQPIEVVAKDSLIVISQVFIAEDGSKDTICDYASYELSNTDLKESDRANYINKSPGAEFLIPVAATENNVAGNLRTTIQCIYEFVQVYANKDVNESVMAQ